MRISINGETQMTEAATLAELVDALGFGDARVATALNGAFVPARARDDARLSDSDEIEIVSPRQGG